MTEDTTCQGWKNHATWCVNLWLANEEGTMETCPAICKSLEEKDQVVRMVITAPAMRGVCPIVFGPDTFRACQRYEAEHGHEHALYITDAPDYGAWLDDALVEQAAQAAVVFADPDICDYTEADEVRDSGR